MQLYTVFLMEKMILSTIMPRSQNLREQHVAVLAFPFGSHDLTILNLARRLARAAPNVQFSFFSTAKSNDLLFSTFKLDVPNNLKVYNVEAGVPIDYIFSGNPLEPVELFLEATPENFKKSLNAAVLHTGRKISCLLTDVFLSFAEAMADEMRVSWITVYVGMPHDLSAHVYTDLIRQRYRHGGCAEDAAAVHRHQTLDFIPGLSRIHVVDLPEELLLPGDSKESLFSCTLYKIAKVLPKASAVVMNFCQELYSKPLLNDLKSMFPNLLNVGFLTQALPPLPLPPSHSDETGCLSWLDKQKARTVVYISFGTVATPPPDELTALAQALEDSRFPFLWVLGEKNKRHLPSGFVQRTSMYGKMVSWAPQTLVLGHDSTGVFVTHCGANSVFESIANEVPMICRPFFGDHRMNGRIVEEIWGIGVRIEGLVFTKRGVLMCLELIFGNDGKGRQMRERIQVLNQLVLTAAGPNGSATHDFNILVETILKL